MKYILLLLFLCSCASVDELQKAQSCKVWNDDFLFPPTSVDVGATTASWTGQCKNIWWSCKSVSVESKLNSKGTKDVFVTTSINEEKINWDTQLTSIGTIEGDEFKSAQKNYLEKAISLTPMKVDSVKKTVSWNANIHFIGTTSTATYYFNDHCSNEQALLGAIAVSTVSGLNQQSPK